MLGTAACLPAQLAGAYSVGPSGNYPNMAAAIAALTTNGVVAPVTFVVTANDTGPWTIGAFPGQGPNNPVVFDGFGLVTIAGSQPVLTLTGCASVTFRGFSGTFAASPNSFLINAGTTDCVFSACDFHATLATSGSASGSAALFNFQGGSGCRIEDSSFGGAWEALYSGVASSNTTVQRCRITGGGWWIMRLGGADFTLVNNFITGTSNYGIAAGISGAANGPNLKIWHNTVVINHPSNGSQYCSLRWYTSAAGNEVVDNIFCDNYPSLNTTTFNVWCLGTLRPALMNYNCFWSNQVGYVPFYAGANQTLASWQGLGFDLNSLQADPLFIAPTATPPDLSLQVGSPCSTTGTTLPLVLFDYFQAVRTPPVSIGAHEEGSGAAYAVFGPGCVGSAGVASNTASTLPRLGQNPVITFGNLPGPSLAIAMFGLSNSTSTFGPLPFDMTPFGAPGCSGRVSPDATRFLIGAGGSASLTFPIPNQGGLLGFTFYTQGLVLDPGHNALGAVTSDAALAVIGL